MSTPKSRKVSLWVECDSCGVTFLTKDVDKHSQDCPPNSEALSYPYILNGNINSSLNVKKNEEIKGLSANEIENLVFLSQSTMQLCNLAIGDWVVLEIKNLPSIVQKVWPTIEQAVTSVLLPKNILDLYFGETKTYPDVVLTKLKLNPTAAGKIHVIFLGSTKSLEFNQDLIKRLKYSCRGKLFTVGNKITIFYFGKTLKIVIKCIEKFQYDLEDNFSKLTISDEVFYEASDKTEWSLYGSDQEYNRTQGNNLFKIGGLEEVSNELKEIMNSVFNKESSFQELKMTKSVLLYGNSGTGKTMLVNALVKESKINSITVSAPDLYSKYSDSPEEKIKLFFDDAVQNSPSIIVLDEVDLLCPPRSGRITEAEKRIVSTLLVLLDELHDNIDSKVFIIATTNKIDSIDPCFRRCGRFEREIEIPTPNPKARLDIMDKILMDVNHNLDRNELTEISLNTHGFVGADLVSLCTHAAMHASKVDRKVLTNEDFKFAMTKVRASAMREVQIEVPNVKWGDIGGQENLKLILKQAVEWPLKHADSFIRLGITPPKGVLMFGPPGCSKTMIAKALATESGLNFLSIKGPELFSKWVGESERAVREVFRKARQVAPSVIFFDEIDALGGERTSGNSNSVQERVLAQLLTELDGITPLGDVTILAATNRPDKIDKALLRPGRLDRIVYVPLPDKETRREIFKLKFKKMPVENVDIEYLVEETENYSGAELNAVCDEAAMKALEENINAHIVVMEHFEKALNIVTPRTPNSLIQLYEKYTDKNI